MNLLDSPTAVRAHRRGPSEPAPVPVPVPALRERAEAIFGSAGHEAEPRAADGPGVPVRAGTSESSERVRIARGVVEREGETVPGVSVRAGRDGPRAVLARMRTWLFVRCGMEFKTVAALAVVLAVVGGLAVQHYRAGRPHTVRVPPPTLAVPPPRLSATTTPEVTVDIAGKVARPGLRHLPKGARVADALTAAGGALAGTDTTTLNLARPLADGEQILVGVTPPPGAPAAQSPDAPAGPLSLNSATAAQLDGLPGVGPVLAQHILDFRTRHGGFTSLRQLRQVPGIGDRKFATLTPLVQP